MADEPKYQIVDAPKPRGIECGVCGARFEASRGYAWNCRTPGCPFPYALGSFQVVENPH